MAPAQHNHRVFQAPQIGLQLPPRAQKPACQHQIKPLRNPRSAFTPDVGHVFCLFQHLRFAALKILPLFANKDFIHLLANMLQRRNEIGREHEIMGIKISIIILPRAKPLIAHHVVQKQRHINRPTLLLPVGDKIGQVLSGRAPAQLIGVTGNRDADGVQDRVNLIGEMRLDLGQPHRRAQVFPIGNRLIIRLLEGLRLAGRDMGQHLPLLGFERIHHIAPQQRDLGIPGGLLFGLNVRTGLNRLADAGFQETLLDPGFGLLHRPGRRLAVALGQRPQIRADKVQRGCLVRLFLRNLLNRPIVQRVAKQFIETIAHGLFSQVPHIPVQRHIPARRLFGVAAADVGRNHVLQHLLAGRIAELRSHIVRVDHNELTLASLDLLARQDAIGQPHDALPEDRLDGGL